MKLDLMSPLFYCVCSGTTIEVFAVLGVRFVGAFLVVHDFTEDLCKES